MVVPSVTARLSMASKPSPPHTSVTRRIVSLTAPARSAGSSLRRSRSPAKIVSESENLEQPGVRLLAQTFAQGTHRLLPEIWYRAVVHEHKRSRGERRDPTLLHRQPWRRAPDGGEDGATPDLGRNPGEASVGPQGSVGAVYGRLIVFGHVTPDPEAVGVDHPAHHLPRRVALDQQRVFTFQHYGGEHRLRSAELSDHSTHDQAAGFRQQATGLSMRGVSGVRIAMPGCATREQT